MVEKAGDSVPTSNTSPSHPPKFESNLPSHQLEKLVMVCSILGLSPSNEHPSPMLQNLPLILHGSDNLPGTEEGCRFCDGRQLAVSEDPSSVNFSQQLLSSVHEGHEEDENEVMEMDNMVQHHSFCGTLSSKNDGDEVQSESPAPATLNEYECQVKYQAPTKGMKFLSKDEAYEFYNSYAENNGFNVRKGKIQRSYKYGNITKQYFFCSRQGFRCKKKAGNTTRKQREETRTDCKAHIQIALQNGKWVVSNLNLQHNHECDPSPKKSKRGKHSGNKGTGSQKAVEQTGNTPMAATLVDIDSVFADLDQVMNEKSPQATSSTTENNKPNFSIEMISKARTFLYKFIISKKTIEEVFRSSLKSDFIEALETLLFSDVYSQDQNSILEKLRSFFFNYMILEEERSKVQKLFDSRAFLLEELNQLNSDNKASKTQEATIENEILQLEEQLKEKRATKDRLSLERKQIALEVVDKKPLLKEYNLLVPSWEKMKEKADEASKQVSSSWRESFGNYISHMW